MNVCANCPLRLYNDKGFNLQGIGNTWSGNALVLPNVDYKAYKNQDMSFSSQVEIVSAILPTGELDANFYVVPFIRCNENVDIEINDDIIRKCSFYLNRDLDKYQIKDVMLCGEAAKRYLNINGISSYLDTVILDNKTKRRYFVNYSPLVKYTNDKLMESFHSHLNKYYFTIKTKLYDYNFIVI